MTHAYGLSHVGRRRNNEDSFCIAPHLGLYAVADGMGGYEGGEIASRLVVESLLRHFEGETVSDGRGAASVLVGAIQRAVGSVAEAARGKLSDMGSTVAALWVGEGRLAVAHVGDSRVYRLRGGRLTQLTRDHSVYAELEAQGKWHILEAMRGQIEHIVTRCIAAHTEAEADIRVEDVHEGDVYLLCSDGLTDALSNDAIEAILLEHDPEKASDALVERAYHAGSSDNITAVVVAIPLAAA